MEHIKPILDIFRTHNIILYIILICSGVITFDIYGLRLTLGVEVLGQPYIALVGVLFLISLSCLVFLIINNLFGNLVAKITLFYEKRAFERELTHLLENLSDKEVAVVLIFFILDAETIWLPMQGPEITSLVRKKLIFLSSKNGRGIPNGMQIFHYSISPGVSSRFIERYPLFFGEDFDKTYVNKFLKTNTPSYIEEMHEVNKRWNLY